MRDFRERLCVRPNNISCITLPLICWEYIVTIILDHTEDDALAIAFSIYQQGTVMTKNINLEINLH